MGDLRILIPHGPALIFVTNQIIHSPCFAFLTTRTAKRIANCSAFGFQQPNCAEIDVEFLLILLVENVAASPFIIKYVLLPASPSSSSFISSNASILLTFR